MTCNFSEEEILITISSLKFHIQYLNRNYEKYHYPATLIEANTLSKVIDEFENVYNNDLKNRS